MSLDLGLAEPAPQVSFFDTGFAAHGRVAPDARGQMSKALPDVTGDMARLLAIVGKEQDIEAFECIFRVYAPRVRAYMLKRARDGQLAEELMQETMMTVWRKAAQFDAGKGNPSAWIFTIARNLRIDSLRRARTPDFDPNDPAFVPEPEPSADTAILARETEARLHAALRDLPKEQHDLLRMAFFDEVSHSEIAQRLDLPLGTVKSRIRLAFAKLRAALGERP